MSEHEPETTWIDSVWIDPETHQVTFSSEDVLNPPKFTTSDAPWVDRRMTPEEWGEIARRAVAERDARRADG